MDSRFQITIRPKGQPPCDGLEVKTEHYQNDIEACIEVVSNWMREQLEYLIERGGEDGTD